MGGRFSRQEQPTSPLLLIRTTHKKPIKVIMLGLEDRDMKELIPHLGLGKDPTVTIPTIGINIKTIDLANQLVFYSWNIRDSSRRGRFWRSVKRFMAEYDVMVFVVDAADRDRLFEARDELESYLRLDWEEQGKLEKETALLILATRCEYPQAWDLSEIRDAFELITGERKWRIQGCDATTGEGVVEGLEWVAAQFSGVVP
ncbi:MAG: ADP-ribosylation factor family-domain-containing protein [Linnemannia elongata]|nr:MAG: ADP-ribosylation factor family-domain-containing protein [Linnemannia elongata]